MKTTRKSKSKPRQAEILREYGPYPGMNQFHGVTFDGKQVWFACGESVVALDPKSGTLVREIAVAAEAGTAFDGGYLWQLADDRIQKVDPRSDQVVAGVFYCGGATSGKVGTVSKPKLSSPRKELR